MKILTIGNFTTGWDGSICDEEHIANALEGLGHEVIRWQRENVASGQTNMPSGEFDFTLIQQWDRYPDNLDKLPRPLVYFAFDYQADGQAWHEQLVSQSDLYLSKRIADSKYPNWQWLSQDFSPMFLDRIRPYIADRIEKDIDVLFTGSYLPWATERIETLKAVDNNFNLTIHSFTPDAWKAEGFKNVYGPVMDDALPELIARAKINLSIDHTIEAGYWSDRNAQIMACGGLVLFKYVPLSEAIFRDNIIYYYDRDDCLNKISQLLEMPEEDRDLITAMSHDYAQKHLMVDNRVSDLLAIVESIL